MNSNSFKPSNLYDYKDERVINVQTFINPRRVTRYLVIVVLVLASLSLLGHFALYCLPDFPMRDFFASKFALNEEQNFPTLYSSLALFCCSVLFWLIARLKLQPNRNDTRYWKGLAIVFVYLSLDELLGLHESFSKPLHKLGVDGVLHNAWVVPGVIAIFIFLMTFYKFFLTLPRFLKRSILIAICLWVGGVIFIETVGGYYKFLNGEGNIGYALITTVEEVMEMLGIVVLIHGLLVYINKLGNQQINFKLNLGQSQVNDSTPQTTQV